MIALLSPYTAYLKIGLCVGAAAALFGAGYKVADWRGDAMLADAKLSWQQEELQRQSVIHTKQQHQLETRTAVDTLQMEGAARVRSETKAVTTEVIQYVQKPVPERVVLSADWVRIHDLAAAPSVPAASTTSGELDGGARTASDAEVLAVVTGNYNECRRYIEQIRGLQAYIREVVQP